MHPVENLATAKEHIAVGSVLTVIGCGNPNRCDDGVGVVVARRLGEYVARHDRAGVQVFDTGTDGMAVMFRARGAKRLVIVDAGRTGAEPGAIFKIPGAVLEQDYRPVFSLHDFRWDHALYAGRRIFGTAFPSEVTVFLIEAARLDLGCELTDPVRLAADRVAGEIELLIDRSSPEPCPAVP